MTWVPMPRKATTTASSRQSAGYASAIVIAGAAGASAGGHALGMLASTAARPCGYPAIPHGRRRRVRFAEVQAQ